MEGVYENEYQPEDNEKVGKTEQKLKEVQVGHSYSLFIHIV